MYISVHMIVKETTKLGMMFLEQTLRSLKGFPDQLVIVDNGSTIPLNSEVVEEIGILDDFTLVQQDGNFSELRQKAIEETSSYATHCMIVDSDEIFFEGNLEKVRKNLENIKGSSYGYFRHFVQSPTYIQEVLVRNNVFEYKEDLCWNKGVHEVLNAFEGELVDNGSEWMHCGYLKSTVATAIKWIHYDVLEFGHADKYKEPDRLMCKLGIDKILSDRKNNYNLYDARYPEYFYPILREYERSKSLNWQDWVTNVVDPQYGILLEEFNEMAAESSWATVIDYIVENKLWEKY